MFVSELRWTPRRQGDLGEISAMEWLVAEGADIFVPVVGCPAVDVIAMFDDDRVVRVQVKTSTCWRNGRWEVTVCTRGGNQSWNGVVKRLEPSRCDALFVHVGDGRRWCIPMSAVEGGSGIRLGGPKYAEYEVEPGRPLQARPKAETPFER
jgi:hypothetical protein